jgi:hypothetical protein
MPHADRLQEHITGTYESLRIGVVVVGAALPIVLWLGGWIGDSEPLRASMSAYYYSPTMGDVFVGTLVAVGVILFLYKGFSGSEDWGLNFAGLFALGVALVPTDPPGFPARAVTWHGTFAVLFFACIAYICIFRASDTLSLVRDTARAKQLRQLYRLLGAAMIGAPLLAALLAFWLRGGSGPSRVVFFVEAAGVWVFAGYWLVKSLELRKTGAARLALQGKLRQMATASPSQPGVLVQVEPDSLRVDDWNSVVDPSG